MSCLYFLFIFATEEYLRLTLIYLLMHFKVNPYNKLRERKVIQVSRVPGCAWSSSSPASCNYCVERARPPSVSAALMEDCGSGAGKTCSGGCDENFHISNLQDPISPALTIKDQ